MNNKNLIQEVKDLKQQFINSLNDSSLDRDLDFVLLQFKTLLYKVEPGSPIEAAARTIGRARDLRAGYLVDTEYVSTLFDAFIYSLELSDRLMES
jgi:hypothetical protein